MGGGGALSDLVLTVPGMLRMWLPAEADKGVKLQSLMAHFIVLSIRINKSFAICSNWYKLGQMLF